MPEPPKLDCPNCKIEMKASSINATPVFVCVQCGHFLMNINALQEILGVTLKEHVHDVNSSEAAHCPGCKGEMHHAGVGGGGIDMCPSCDVAMTDRGSLSQMGASSRSVQGFVFKLDEARNLSRGVEPVQNLVVDSAFVLHNSGLLITSFSQEGESKVDEDILAGMISAITSFVQDSFRGFHEGQPLQSIRFKGKEIAFEHGNYLILAFEVSGTMDEPVRSRIAEELVRIESANGNVLESWNGDVSHLEGLVERFREMLVPMGS